MEDVLWTAIVTALGLVAYGIMAARESSRNSKYLLIALLGHVVGAITQVLLVLYYFPSGGDMLTYYDVGVMGAELLRSDFGRFAPELMAAFLQSPNYQLPIELIGSSSTLSMCAASAFVLFGIGNSIYAASTLVGVASFVSQYMIFRALREHFPKECESQVLVGTTLLPSAIIWSSALLKEPLIMAAMGPLLLGLHWLATKRGIVASALLLGPASLVVAVLKPYVLIALSLSAAVFYFWSRFFVAGRLVIRPFALVIAVAIGGGGLVMGARYFAKSDQDLGIGGTIAQQRRTGYEIEGGSNYSLDLPTAGSEDVTNRSVFAELLLAPLALITALFRPFLFEARNAVQFLNALEATYLLWLSFRMIRDRRWGGVVQEIRSSPALMFCLVFTLSLALATGLASSNLGSLSRYRAPMMPFFFATLLVLQRRETGSRLQPASAEAAQP